MEFDYTQTNKQVQVMALRLERGGELGGDVAINRRCHAHAHKYSGQCMISSTIISNTRRHNGTELG